VEIFIRLETLELPDKESFRQQAVAEIKEHLEHHTTWYDDSGNSSGHSFDVREVDPNDYSV
jgi:hypothetical protein